MIDFPIVVFVVSGVALWLATWLGGSVWARRRVVDDHTRSDYAGIAGATLTLLGLIIGFSYSMAVSRYDLRKSYEEVEANTIGTEFLRADLLPAADAQQVRVLLRRYVDMRIRDYETRDAAEVQKLKEQTGQLQEQLWSAVQAPATAKPSATVALAVSGMNEVLDAQGSAQAASWNRLPRPVWWLMGSIAIIGCAFIGHGVQTFKAEAYFIWVLPAVISISFYLIAEIDSPRAGLIRVAPQNLIDTAQSMGAAPAAPSSGR